MSESAPQMSALDRIKAAMAAKAANAAAAPATTTSDAFVDNATKPGADVKTVQAEVVKTEVKTELKTETKAEPSAPANAAKDSTNVQASTNALTITDEATANNVLAMFSMPVEGENSLSAIGDAIENGGGVRHSHPFAQIKKGNWEAHKSAPPAVFEHMPVGNRPFRAIYLGHRLGMNGWAGGSTANGGGQPPIWSAVSPTPFVHKGAGDLARQILHIGSKVQYTKRANRAKYDTVGRLVPELQVFMWGPATGFFIVTTPGYNATQLALAAIKKIEDKVSGPILVSMGKETEENPKAEKTEERSWDIFYASFELAADERGGALLQAFVDYRKRDSTGLATELMKFHRGEDYDGLKLEELSAKLKAYLPLIG